MGWRELDVILISGDAYVDHPSFGTALIGRVLWDAGFTVGIVAQPDWKSSVDFTKLVFVSVVIALPLSYLITKSWLDGFAYKIPLNAWYFVAAGLAALLISWLTVAMQAAKAAATNPVKSLKYE